MEWLAQWVTWLATTRLNKVRIPNTKKIYFPRFLDAIQLRKLTRGKQGKNVATNLRKMGGNDGSFPRKRSGKQSSKLWGQETSLMEIRRKKEIDRVKKEENKYSKRKMDI